MISSIPNITMRHCWKHADPRAGMEPCGASPSYCG